MNQIIRGRSVTPQKVRLAVTRTHFESTPIDSQASLESADVLMNNLGTMKKSFSPVYR